MMKGSLNNKMVDFSDLENFVNKAKNQMEMLDKEAMNTISKLPKEKRAEMLDILTRAKNGEITVEEVQNIMKQWQ